MISEKDEGHTEQRVQDLKIGGCCCWLLIHHAEFFFRFCLGNGESAGVGNMDIPASGNGGASFLSIAHLLFRLQTSGRGRIMLETRMGKYTYMCDDV